MTKRLVVDRFCFAIINHLLTPQELKSKNLDLNNITIIDEDSKDYNFVNTIKEDVIIFIIEPKKEIMNVVIPIDVVLNSIRKDIVKNMIFIPGENHDIIEYMMQNQLFYNYRIESLNFDIIPIDIDLLSLERDDCIKEIYINNNYTSISDLACALVKLESCFGKVKHKYLKGDLAQKFCSLVEEKEIENNVVTNDEILGMVVLDRSVDFLTLMTTNYTCEGLIDDSFGINLGRIKVPDKILKENLTQNPVKSEKLTTFGLTTENNEFYCAFRCMHYIDALKYLNSIRNYYQKIAEESKDKSKSISLDKLKNFTEEFNYYMTNIKNHLIMNENIINHIVKPIKDPNYLKYIEKEQLLLSGDLPSNLYSYYEDHLCEERDLMSLIRLMVLESLTQNGVKDYQNLKREILNIYGYQKIFLFKDLENLGWLKQRKKKEELLNDFLKIIDVSFIEKFNLIKMNSDPQKIDDCSYLLSGFCPLSLRLIENAIEGKWGKTIDILKKMPGATDFPSDETVFSNPTEEKNIIFIVFVGGITYTEIEGVRFLNRKYNEEYKSQKRKKRTQFIILTTGILNSKKIFGSLGKELHSALTMKSFYEENMNKTKEKK